MTAVTFTQRCNTSTSKAWQYLSDHRNMPEYFDGVANFAPTGSEINCLGAIYNVTAKIGPATFKTKVETVEWVPEQTAVFMSTKVLTTNIKYAFTVVDETSCDVELTVDVSVPGGRATSKMLAPFIRASLAKTSTNIAARFGG